MRDYLSISNYGVFLLSNNSFATFYTQIPTVDSSGKQITYAYSGGKPLQVVSLTSYYIDEDSQTLVWGNGTLIQTATLV